MGVARSVRRRSSEDVSIEAHGEVVNTSLSDRGDVELPALGGSPMARAFQAEVTVSGAERGLYVIRGRRRFPFEAVSAVGGEIMVELPESETALAVMTRAAHMALLRHPEVLLAGPVTIDPSRFARFVALAGLDHSSSPPSLEHPP